MARLKTIGWQLGTIYEGRPFLVGAAGNFSVSSGVLVLGASTTGSLALRLDSAVGRTYYARFIYNQSSAPNAAINVFAFSQSTTMTSATAGLQVRTTATGALGLYFLGALLGSVSANLTTGTNHVVEVSFFVGTGTTGTASLRVNGAVIASATGLNTNGVNYATYAGPCTGGVTGSITLNDLKINDNQGAAENSWPNAGALAFHAPIADNAVASNWQKPGGSTANLYTALDNAPPTGVASTTSATNAERQVFNSSGLNAYSARLRSFTDAGASGTILGFHVQGVVGASTASGKRGAFEGLSNPVFGSTPFGTLSAAYEVSDDFYAGAAQGTYPTGWKSVGAYVANPSVALGTSPVVAVNTAGTAGNGALCSLYAYSEWIPAAVPSAGRFLAFF